MTGSFAGAAAGPSPPVAAPGAAVAGAPPGGASCSPGEPHAMPTAATNASATNRMSYCMTSFQLAGLSTFAKSLRWTSKTRPTYLRRLPTETVDCRLRLTTVDCRLRLTTADYRLPTADYRLPTADCRLTTDDYFTDPSTSIAIVPR